MNILFILFFLYAFFFLPRYLVSAGYIKIPLPLDAHARQKAELMYLILIVGIIFSLAGFEKTLSASPAVQSAADIISKAFGSAFHYSLLTPPFFAIALPYLFPVSYSYILALAILTILFAQIGSPLFVILLFVLFVFTQFALHAIVNKRFEPDFRVRLTHAVIGCLAWLAAVYAIPAAISAAIP